MRIRVAPASSQTQFFKKVSLVLQATVLHPRIASSSQNSVGLARHSQKVYWKMYAPQREISNYAAGRKEGMGQWVSLDKKANSKFVLVVTSFYCSIQFICLSKDGKRID
jgi:hypothetical protein